MYLYMFLVSQNSEYKKRKYCERKKEGKILKCRYYVFWSILHIYTGNLLNKILFLVVHFFEHF